MAEENGKQLEVKEVKSVSRKIKPATERMLWGISAGICEFDGCTNKLYSHHVTKEKVNLAEKAHIYAFSKGGKRPSLLRSSAKINDIDNLMLVLLSKDLGWLRRKGIKDKIREIQKVEMSKQYRVQGRCEHCGGKFKGLFRKTCSVCGAPKNY